jgi:transcriptional regulator with PAS, ATPase and Fis domain
MLDVDGPWFKDADGRTLLLRVIQEKEFQTLGSNETIKVDVRILAATNDDLRKLVDEGKFRQDLYYRLNVINIALPPLRDRKEDIPALVDFFFTKYCRENEKFLDPNNRSVLQFQPEAMQILMDHNWPGNVRELENALERALVLGSTDSILPDDFPETVLEAGPTATTATDKYHGNIKETKKQLILQALQQAKGNYIEAAKALGMHPNSLLRLVRTLDLPGLPEKGDVSDWFAAGHLAPWVVKVDPVEVKAALDLLVDYDWLHTRKILTTGRPALLYIVNPKILKR